MLRLNHGSKIDRLHSAINSELSVVELRSLTILACGLGDVLLAKLLVQGIEEESNIEVDEGSGVVASSLS